MTCPRCGSENEATARFCSRCGTALTHAAPILGEERKVVSALFCDIVGFTARSDRADPEDVKAVLAPFHARAKREIERYGGTVDQFIGDAVLGVFGAPTAHEDDPERAVLAAFGVQRAIDQLNEDIPGYDLRARVGVDTGEAVVALGEPTEVGERVTGGVVASAQRLQALAPPGRIAVGLATYRATRDRFVYEDLPVPAVATGGRADPEAAWQPLASRARVAFDVSVEPSTALVGRELELAMLTGVYERAVREPSVQLVTVTGEPGVGKSRVIRELYAHIDSLQDVIVGWRQGRCLPYGEGVSFWALSEIVRAHAGILDSDGPAAASAKLRRAVEAVMEGSEAEWAAARLEPLVGVMGSAGRDATDATDAFAAWRRFFEALAANRPLVLVFEDLHWADEAMLSFIEQLADTALPLPLLILTAARPELYERRPAWGGGKRNSTTIALPPLSEGETATLLSALLSRAVLPADTQRALLDRAGGNPLYAEEFVRMLDDRGILVRGGGTVRLAQAAIPIPDTVQALVAARLDTLSLEQKAVLLDAAVVGEVFWPGAVAAIGGAEEGRIAELLHEMRRRELVRTVRTSSVQGQPEFAFWHLVVRDVAYGQLPKAARVAKHRAVAGWIERLTGDRAADFAELLVHHYIEALELSRTYHPEEQEDLRTAAVRALAMAAGRAEQLDLTRADARYRQALDLMTGNDPGRPRLLAREADVAAALGRFEEAEAGYEAATRAMRASDDLLGLGETLARWARALHRGAGNLARARDMTRQSIELLEGLPPGPELARAYGRAAAMAFVDDRNEECLERATRALRLAEELGMDDETVRASVYRGAARCELGDRGGLEDLRAAVRAGQEAGLGEETVVAYGNLGYELWMHEGPEASLDAWRRAKAFAEKRDDRTSAMWAAAGEVESLFDLGRFDELLAVTARLIEWDQESGPSPVGVLARAYRAWVLARRGRGDEAADLARATLPGAREMGYAEYLAPALVAAAVAEDACGRPDAARELDREFLRITEDHPGYRLQHLFGVMPRLARWMDPKALTALIPPEDPRWSRHIALGHVGARAVAARAAGDLAAAAALFAEAADGWAEMGAPPLRAWALVGRAACALPAGDAAEGGRAGEAGEPASEVLAELALARGILEMAGMTALVEEADALIRRGGSATSDRSGSGAA